jgi:hypothetical protein
VTTTVQRPQDLIDDVLVACLGTSRRRIDEVPAVDAFVKLISLQESLLDIDFVQLHIMCERHHEASYSKTWRRREIIDIIYASPSQYRVQSCVP